MKKISIEERIENVYQKHPWDLLEELAPSEREGLRLSKEAHKVLSIGAIVDSIKDVKEGKVKLSPNKAKFCLKDFIPGLGVLNYHARNFHNYWCIPELRTEIDTKRMILALYSPFILGIPMFYLGVYLGS